MAYQYATHLATPLFNAGDKYNKGILVGTKIYGLPMNKPSILYYDINKPNEITSIDVNINPQQAGWIDAVLAPNGKLYCIPDVTVHPNNYPSYVAGKIICIDTADNSVTVLSGDLPYSSKRIWTSTYSEGILANNDKIYAIPWDIDHILCIDTNTDTFTTIGTFSNDYSGWKAPQLAPNGKIYAISNEDENSILRIDPTDNTYTKLFNLQTDLNLTYTGYENWCDSFLIGDEIYYIPFTSSSIVCLNTTTETIRKIGEFGSGAKWCNAILAPNNKIYAFPYEWGIDIGVLCFDLTDETYTIFGDFSNIYNAGWSSSVIGEDNKIYAFSKNDTQLILSIDLVDNSYSFQYTPSYSFSSSILGTDGNIYCIPHRMSDSYFLKLSQVEPTAIEPYENKYDYTYNFGSAILKMFSWNLSDCTIFKDTDYIWFINEAHAICIDPINNTSEKIIIDEYEDINTGAVHSPDDYYINTENKIYKTPDEESYITIVDKINKNVVKLGEFEGTSSGDYYYWSKWCSGVLAPNNKIYSAPCLSYYMLSIDTETDTYETFGTFERTTYPGYEQGILNPDGNTIYFFNDKNCLVFDIATETYFIINYPSTYIFRNAVLSNDKIYLAPVNTSYILYLDITSNTFSTINLGKTCNIHSKPIPIQDKIYYIGDSIICVDVINNTSEVFGVFSIDQLSDLKCIITYNNKIYAIISYCNSILCINTLTNTYKLIGDMRQYPLYNTEDYLSDDYDIINLNESYKFYNFVLGADNRLYGLPTYGTIFCFDLDTETSIFYENENKSFAYIGVLADNDDIYALPTIQVNSYEVETIPMDWKYYALKLSQTEQDVHPTIPIPPPLPVPETTLSAYVKVDNVYKPIVSMYVKTDGTYKQLSSMFSKINNEWVNL